MPEIGPRGTRVLLAVALVVSAAGLTAVAQPVDRNTAPTWGRCVKPDQNPEIFGPTDLNAQSANGGLAVGLNDEATITVLRYPRPSFYDQVKYHTTTREEPRLGVAPNEGAFLGLVVRTADATSVTWLRDWDAAQTYQPQSPPGPGVQAAEPFTDVVRTSFTNATLGLTVTVRDVVEAPPTDVLHRKVDVNREASSPVTDVELVAFENLNLVVSKTPQIPTQDWCQEEENRDLARYLPGPDAIVHTKQGIDRSTREHRSVAVGMAFRQASASHQVGGDAHEPTANPLARIPSPVQGAYEDVQDGQLRGNDLYRGQTTGALTRDLAVPSPGIDWSGSATLLVAGEADRDAVAAALEDARQRSFEQAASAKEAWIRERLAEAPMPDVPDAGAPSDGDVTKLARRALASLVTTVDRRSQATVASIATQSPYGQDWIRDGAYFDLALDLVGLNTWVEQHERWYADVQHRAGDARDGALATPPGNWAMVYYADGVAGGPIPYEIDETGYGIWTLWHHYTVTGDRAYLEDVYPAIRAAGDHLVRCEDPRTGLQCHAWEDDNYVPEQSVVGAELAWLGLDAARMAAQVLERTDDAERFAERKAELGAAIDEHLWNEADGQYGTSSEAERRLRTFGPVVPAATAPAELAWPVCYQPSVEDATERMDQHNRSVWERINRSFDEPGDTQDNGDEDQGLYESKGLLALAKAWKDEPERMDRIREGLRWVADRHATDDTHVMGEVWVEEDGEIVSRVSMPHLWEQTLFYLAALEAWPPDSVPADVATTPSCGGVTGYLLGR